MSDWLAHYNSLDTMPLVEAMENSFEKFHEFFGVDALLALSLPGLAFK